MTDTKALKRDRGSNKQRCTLGSRNLPVNMRKHQVNNSIQETAAWASVLEKGVTTRTEGRKLEGMCFCSVVCIRRVIVHYLIELTVHGSDLTSKDYITHTL